MRKLIILCLLIAAGCSCLAQNVSNEGRNFFAVFPTHDPSSNLAEITIYITSKANSEATVQCGSFTLTQPIPANTAVEFKVPRANAYIDISESNKTISNRAIHITVAQAMPKVAVYAHIFAGFRSAASLILPFDALGQAYYSMNYGQPIEGNGQNSGYLTIVAAEPNTTVLIHELNSNIKKVSLPNTGDIYQYVPQSGGDLTGIFAEVDPSNSSCKRFGMFSGSTSIQIGCDTSSRPSYDPLFQQLYSTNSWGKNFGIVPFYNRKYIIRILAKEDNTTVKFNGKTISLQNGKFFTSPQLKEAQTLSSDKPISVAQYSLSQECSSADSELQRGDPEMVLLNPVEFNIKSITMFSSDQEIIVERYVNVYTKTSGIASFRYNGKALDFPWKPMPDDPLYSYNQIPVIGKGKIGITLSCNEGFNAIAYGFGVTESYAYSAGTSLAASQFITFKNTSTGSESTEACQGQLSEIKITLPARAVKLTWKFPDGTQYVDPAPAEMQSNINGQLFYSYTLGIDTSFTTQGSERIVVLAQSPINSGGCSVSELEYVFDLVINPLPVAGFETDIQRCSTKEVEFTDKSTSALPDTEVNKWHWDFGDGTTSSLQHPTHRFASAGTFNVTLRSGIAGGCFSDPVTKQITIFPTPVAAFNVNLITCINMDVPFTDVSTITGGTITKWTWDFGDGTVVTKTGNGNIVHKYLTVNTYTVKLVVESNSGCESDTLYKTLVLKHLPSADFVVPEICLTDPEAVFTNRSYNPDGSVTGLTFLWDFGDPNATPGNPNNSSNVNGRHKYTALGEYTVTLTITNPDGCTVFLQQVLTVNGDAPQSVFEVQNASSLCSNRRVVVKNLSYVNSGNITRLEFFTDFLNDPSKVVVIEDPVFNKLYELDYPVFSSPPTKSITLRLVAYSGQTCANATSEIIVLKASPVVVFDQVPPICIANGIVQFKAVETGNSAGTGTYSGNGVSGGGVFDPVTAGLGFHPITFSFVNDNGCSDSKSQIVEVLESPVAYAGLDAIILFGGEKQLGAAASGPVISYKWTPSKGLDKDNVLNPVASPEEDTEYTLTVTTERGCSMSDKVFVKVEGNVAPVNSFTPNGDGINDVWNIKYAETYPKATIEIFNRYGKRLFHSIGYNTPFDGNYNNTALPAGTYYYKIDPGRGKRLFTGSLTILR